MLRLLSEETKVKDFSPNLYSNGGQQNHTIIITDNNSYINFVTLSCQLLNHINLLGPTCNKNLN